MMIFHKPPRKKKLVAQSSIQGFSRNIISSAEKKVKMSSALNQQQQQFHRQKCQDALQLIATIVDSSTPSFFPPNENATRLVTSVQGTTTSSSSSVINGKQYN